MTPYGVRGKLPADLDQLGIDALRDGAVAVEQLFAGLVEELRVGSQVREELLERAREADLLLDGFHLGADARDFLQAERVDVLRREIGRRVVLREIAVARQPAARPPPADAVVGRRQVFAIHELEQLRERRLHARADAIDGRFRRGARDRRQAPRPGCS